MTVFSRLRLPADQPDIGARFADTTSISSVLGEKQLCAPRGSQHTCGNRQPSMPPPFPSNRPARRPIGAYGLPAQYRRDSVRDEWLGSPGDINQRQRAAEIFGLARSQATANTI